MRYMLADGLRAAMRPLALKARRHKGGQPPGRPDRHLLAAPLYLARTGAPWSDLPGELGRRGAVHNRFRRRVASGALRRRSEALTADPAFGEPRRVLTD